MEGAASFRNVVEVFSYQIHIFDLASNASNYDRQSAPQVSLWLAAEIHWWCHVENCSTGTRSVINLFSGAAVSA
jgi:hypothetical protein